ncbi:hypothetical protein RND71_026096 [Anisodus tanguticus]|uniref:Major facilitator superfamily (MFS) profile domain-containing protein n=1 Tax=Anisodus tanguticus TaxID=243964 RepID=A0AAE1V3G8_9SOLA|nr:hypothetical protein RND71_026096 [Anisodus tanguticus]
MSISPKFTNTKDYSSMSTSPENSNKVYKHYTSINDLKPVGEDCTHAMILLGSDKTLQVGYPGNNENPINVDAIFDFSNLASRQSKLTFSTRMSKRVFENQFGDNQSAKRFREESTFPVDTTTSSGTDTDFSVPVLSELHQLPLHKQKLRRKKKKKNEDGAAQSDRSQKAVGSYYDSITLVKDDHADGMEFAVKGEHSTDPTDSWNIAISRGLNGIGLAIVTPAIQSLVADSTNASNRGTAFGWLQLTSNVGSTLGGLISVLLAETSLMGIPGWRISFHLVGIISVAVGILVRLFARDPRFLVSDGNAKDQPPPQPFQEEVRQLLKEAKAVMRVPSFQLLIAQGISGSFPWSALSFAPMWLELIGFSHKATAFLWTSFNVAQSLGALFGGTMGDVLAKHLPNSGRIILAQISFGSAVPLAAILLLLLPYDPSTVVVCPIFAEIVPERARTSIYALDRSFESVISSFAPPLVGILAQHVFGFKPIPTGSTGSEEIATDRQNDASLAKALYTAIGIPISLCCFFYSFLYCTYPRDRDCARLQHTEETGNSPSEERQALLENDEQRLLSVS